MVSIRHKVENISILIIYSLTWCNRDILLYNQITFSFSLHKVIKGNKWIYASLLPRFQISKLCVYNEKSLCKENIIFEHIRAREPFSYVLTIPLHYPARFTIHYWRSGLIFSGNFIIIHKINFLYAWVKFCLRLLEIKINVRYEKYV